VWTVLGWVVVGGLAALAAATVLRISGHAAVAVAQDALVYLLALAWVVLIVGLTGRAWLLAGSAAFLVAYQLVLLIPRRIAARVPRWVRDAPRVELVVANVFIDNETPAALARALLARGGDMMVILEWNAVFVREFDAAGGREAYPHRVFDPADTSDYAVGVVSKTPLREESKVLTLGRLKLTQTVVDMGGPTLTILSLNPTAAVDPGGFEEWEQQLDELIRFVPSLHGPFVVAGDLNTTTYRPKVRELLATGLTDSHESLGQGLSSSFKLSADGVLAVAGAVVGLDHVFLSDDVRAISAEDLPSEGSDHVPFVVTLAVRPASRPQH
jgi:endonuclease/exonuclease/phosphatase (EEP) superfamily protein YafD